MISARFLLRSDAASRRSLKWRVAYRRGVLLCRIAFRVRKKAVRYSVNIALNYTILGNYKNVYVTGKSAYFTQKKKRKKKCICTNIYQRDRVLKENFGSAGCTQISSKSLNSSLMCRSEKQFSVFCSPSKALLDYKSLKVFYHNCSLPGTFGQGIKMKVNDYL